MEAKKITTLEELEKAFQLRIDVFVHEQGVPLEEELDQYDNLNEACDHVLAYYQGEAVGAARVRIVEGVGKLERIVVLKPFRKFGLGKVIVEKLEALVKKKGIDKVKLHGQVQAQQFYEKLGYKAASAVFLEDGIEHILMTKEMVD